MKVRIGYENRKSDADPEAHNASSAAMQAVPAGLGQPSLKLHLIQDVLPVGLAGSHYLAGQLPNAAPGSPFDDPDQHVFRVRHGTSPPALRRHRMYLKVTILIGGSALTGHGKTPGGAPQSVCLTPSCAGRLGRLGGDG